MPIHINEHEMVLGVDGYRGGWITHVFNGPYATKHIVDTYPTFDELIETYHQARAILVDIPIGLPENGYRQVDIEARQVLDGRRSSVFFVPVRETFTAETYEDACAINEQITGKKISRQVWNIMPKIREVDTLLIHHPNLRSVVLESHPEVVFWALNNQSPMAHNKKTEAGYMERLEVLRKYHPHTDAAMAGYRWGGSLQPYKRDDFVDALALAVAAQCGSLTSLAATPASDAAGLPMQIVYPQVENTAL